MEKNFLGLKNKNFIIIFLASVNVLLVALLVYFLLIRKDINTIDSQKPNSVQSIYSKIDESKENYYVITGQSYDLHYTEDGEHAFFLDNIPDEKIDLSYPVVNINTTSVLNLNKKIEKIFSDLENQLKNKQNENGCTCVKLNDSFYCGGHIMQPSFKVYEDDKFITLIIRRAFLTNCASGYVEDDIYTVSKKEGKEITNDDIINYFGYSRSIINDELPKYIQNSLRLLDIDITSSELDDIRNNLMFSIVNGKLIIGVNIIDQPLYYSYDGNSFVKIDDFTD